MKCVNTKFPVKLLKSIGFFYWNKQFENIGHPMCNMKQDQENWNNIDINSLVCKCDLFFIIFNEIANFLKQLAENVIYIKAVFNSFLLHWITYQKFGRVMNCVKEYTLYIDISVCRSAHAEKGIETASSKRHTCTWTAGLFTRLNTGHI